MKNEQKHFHNHITLSFHVIITGLNIYITKAHSITAKVICPSLPRDVQ